LVVSWHWLDYKQFMKVVIVAELPARRSVSASTLPLIKTSGQSSTAVISSRMAASEKNNASSPAMANSNIIDFKLLHSKMVMALQVHFVEGSQVEVPFQSNDSGTLDHGDDDDDDYDHEYNNHRESFSLYEEDGSTSAMKMSHFIRRISLYNPIVSGGDDVDPNKQPIKMGTFVGVFMPCIQNIFGVLFFIRLAWIVGTAGVLQGFLITFICCLVTFTTCISLSAIATNGMVPAGGPYYMISRNLGPELGGAVGILFYFASTIAASMYLLGSAEIFLLYTVPQAKIFDDIYNCYRLIGTLLLAIVSCIVLAGVGVVNRFALPTIALVNGCILLTFIGFFVNINGSDSLKFCMVGDRIPNLQHWIDNNPGNYLSCNATDLKHLFCANVTETGSCDPYFLKSANEGTIKEMNAIVGATSGIILDNLFSKYLDTNDFIQSNDSKITNNEYEEISDTYVVADMASSFTILIGVFFPSVTGIMQGSNRSGNLRDASRSIPVGTLAAQIITSIAYLLGVLCFGASMNGMFLRDKFGAGAYGRLAAAELAVPHPMVIVIGSFIASAGAGMQCLTGAPRLLQAIALDGVIPMLHYFQKSTKRGEPLRAIFVSIAICELFILIAFLESITALISQFFLMCYLSVNAACVLQSVLKAPSWRPRFRFYHWSLSMFGAALCVAVMFMSHWIFACVAIIIGMIAYKYIEYRGAEKEWGDGIRGLRLAAASYALTNLEEGPVHTKNWRPQLLVLCTVSSDRTNIENEQIVAFASQLKAGNIFSFTPVSANVIFVFCIRLVFILFFLGKGLTVLASVLNGKFLNMLAEVAATKMIMKEVCRRMKIRGFCEVLVAGDVTEGMSALVQTSGLGGLKHNTVIMSWPQKWRNGNFEAVKFVETIRLTTAAKSALVVIKDVQQFPSNKEKIVGCMDVWWILHDGGIMILLAFLLRQNRVWRNTKLRIFTVCQSEEDLDKVRESMKTFIYHLRMDATVDVVCLTKYDISEYAHELTLKREQRQKMLDQLGLTDRQKDIDVDNAISNSTSAVQSGAELPVQNRTNLLALDNLFKNDKTNEGNEATSNATAEQCEEEKLPIPSVQTYNIRCLQRAKKLNEAIQSRSRESDLIFLNLPDPGRNGYEKFYMEYIEVMTTGLNRVVLIKGTGSEVVTIFS
ncbi:Solute carrier family 12 member 6, partial [Trichinella zimbabwensis]